MSNDLAHPTLTAFVRHAKLFGTEGVEETAAGFLGESALARLRVELDALERNRRSPSGYSIGKPRRRSASETATAVVQLSVEGLVVSAIADRLGISDKRVKALLRAA